MYRGVSVMSDAGSIYDLKKTTDRLEIRFSSTMPHIDDVCTAVSLFLESKSDRFSPHLFAVNLVLREGLTNAVRHGNKNDPDKLVIMDLDTKDKDFIKVSISDQGDGFQWQAVRQMPVLDEADHGRGLTIMDTYFDSCRYNNKGNVLFLEKRILS